MRLAENQCRPSLIRRRFSSSLVERPIKRLGEGTVDRAIERSSVGGILQTIKKSRDRVIECSCDRAIKQWSDGAMKRSSDLAGLLKCRPFFGHWTLASKHPPSGLFFAESTLQQSGSQMLQHTTTAVPYQLDI